MPTIPENPFADKHPACKSWLIDPSNQSCTPIPQPEHLNILGESGNDEEVIQQWISLSYGMRDEEYHRAYAKELIRQTRFICYSPDLPAWI